MTKHSSKTLSPKDSDTILSLHISPKVRSTESEFTPVAVAAALDNMDIHTSTKFGPSLNKLSANTSLIQSQTDITVIPPEERQHTPPFVLVIV